MSLLLVVVPILLVVILVLSMRRDARWLGNALLLMLAAVSVLFVLAAASESGAGSGNGAGSGSGAGVLLGAPAGAAMVVLVVLSPPLVVILAVFLLCRGASMLRRRGAGAASLVPLLSGIGVLVVAALAAATLMGGASPWLLAVAAFLFVLSSWAGFLLVSFVVFTVVYGSLTGRGPAGFVLVHGAGLTAGRMPRLLENRVDAGIAHWRRIREDRPDALLVLSGGRTSGSSRSEAAAMAEYAGAHGVPQEAMVLEEASGTTVENLREVQALRGDALPADGPGLSVTSSFHVLRTAALARDVGLDVQVAPARSAGMLWPSAFVHETVLLIGRNRILHAVLALLVSLPLPLLIVLTALEGA